jgi:hypothetical protein
MKKLLVVLGILVWLSGLVLLASVLAQGTKSKEPKSPKDATKTEKAEFPFKAREIKISEKEIYVRTEDGQEFLVGENGEIRIPVARDKDLMLKGAEDLGQIVVEGGKIKIGDKEIDLSDLKDLEDLRKLPRIKIPQIRITPRTETGEGIFRMGSDVVVGEDESIDGDVVALWGNVTVKGAVSGDAVSIGGDVDIYPTGVVEGNAVSVGGNVTKQSGSVVEGEKISVGFFRGQPIKFAPFVTTRVGMSTAALLLRIIRILLLIFVGIVVVSVAPRQVNKVRAKVKQNFLKSGLVGFLAEILVLPIFLLLVITIIGIPVALLVEPILILAALFLGFAAVSLFIGEKIGEHTSLKPDTRVMAVVIGVLAVELVPLASRVIGMFGGLFSPLAFITALVGWLIVYVVITVGFGAAVMTRLGTRPKDAAPVSVPAEPGTADSAQPASS